MIAANTDNQIKKPQTLRLFPLHLTSFEHYMVVDDRPRYPMTFIVQLELSGELQSAAFDDAIEKALKRHPLLTAVVGPGKSGKDCWIAAPHLRPYVDWGDLDAPIEFPHGEYIDIRHEIGLRMFVRHDDRKAIVTAQFHHSTCDGIGAYQFLGDVLYYYAQQTGDAELEPLAELDLKRLKGRGKVSYDPNNFRLPSGKYQRNWDEVLAHVVRTNVVLKAPTSKPTTFSRPFPGIQSFIFDKSDFKHLRLAAQSRGQIMNDMLLEKLFESLHAWNQKHRWWPLRKHVAVMMPLNLREPTDNDLSACNVVAQAFVRRTAAQVKDKEKFRSDLGEELRDIKHSRHKIRFMHMLVGSQNMYPKLFETMMNWKRSLATAILSNTGDPTKQFYADFPRNKGTVQVGNLSLDGISGVPPLRPGTNVTVSIFTYRRELKICMRCDPNQFSEQDSSELLQAFVENLKLELPTSLA